MAAGGPRLPPAVAEMLRAAGALAARSQYRRLLWVSDLPVPEELLALRGAARKKLLRAVTTEPRRAKTATAATGKAGHDESPAVVLPPYDMTRSEKLRLALIGGIGQGLLAAGDVVLALVSRSPRAWPESLTVTQVGAGFEEEALAHGLEWELGPPQVVEAVLQLAVEVGALGWEGRPVGALFVLGGAEEVMGLSRQLGLNPFHGYSEGERNLLDPRVREAVHAFATLDGAMVVRDDGVVLAAGRYLDVHPEGVSVPLGLGARHMAAAAITAATKATAFAVSQTSGTVRIFRQGRQVMLLNPSRRRI